jgi:hypothetical protein
MDSTSRTKYRLSRLISSGQKAAIEMLLPTTMVEILCIRVSGDILFDGTVGFGGATDLEYRLCQHAAFHPADSLEDVINAETHFARISGLHQSTRTQCVTSDPEISSI